MSLINFTLTEHLLEEKIETATQDVISKTKKKITDDIQRETKDLKKYMDQQFKKSNMAIRGVQSDLVNTSQEFKSIKINQSGSFN